MKKQRKLWTSRVEQVRTATSCAILCLTIVELGLISRELCQYATCVVGVDISQEAVRTESGSSLKISLTSSQVDVYNTRANQQGIPPEEMRAVRAVLGDNDDELDGAKFDVVIVRPSRHSNLFRMDIHVLSTIVCSVLPPFP